MNRPHPRHVRPGFTLIELLVVIVIIGILVALLIPAVMGGIRAARNAQVAAEIQTIAQSLQSFKTKYGDFPPSRVILMENGFYNVTDTRVVTDPAIIWSGSGPPPVATPNPDKTSYGVLAQRSVRYLRKFFPKAMFSTTGAATINGLAINATNGWYDFNGNGSPDANPIYLEGHDCLVFFLGGIPNPNGNGTFAGTGGFSNSPTNPFVSESFVYSATAMAQAQGNRQRPFFEFKADRLRDLDGNGMPCYLDSLGTLTDARPYVYFSAYGGNAYDPNDCNTGGVDDVGVVLAFGAGTSVTSAAPNPYTVNPPVSPSGPKFVNADSYQIISSGADRIYGAGGQYNASGSGDKLSNTNPNATDRSKEGDNLTNFSTGTLQ